MELDARLELDDVGEATVGFDRLGQAGLGQLEVAVELQQRLPARDGPGLIDLGQVVLRVHDVLEAVARDCDHERATPFRLT